MPWKWAITVVVRPAESLGEIEAMEREVLEMALSTLKSC